MSDAPFVVRPTTSADLPGAVALQASAFPPPFPQEYHWDVDDLQSHLDHFPEGQWVAEMDGRIVGTCSNTMVSEAAWQRHGSWYETVGNPDLSEFDPSGTTLYGIDITVHPDNRRMGIGRRFYEARYAFVRCRGLARYGTGCRIPDYAAYAGAHPGIDVHRYADEVVEGRTTDRTLTPLLRYRLCFLEVVENYMKDPESSNAGALLEWTP